MARFDSGWFKFYRRAFFEDIGRNQTCLALWSALLSMAIYKETKIIWQGKQRTLEPGSVVFGLKELAEKWEISKTTVLRWLRYLESTERIRVETGTRGTLVTILNWKEYQKEADECVTPSLHEVYTDVTRTVHEVSLSEEDKKEESKNTLSLSETDTRKRAPKKKRESEPRGAIQEFSTEPLVSEVLADVTQKTQRTWLATYSDASWIEKEILRAVAWYSEKGEVVARWGQAISTWLARSWERKPKTLQFAPGSSRIKKELPPEVAAQFEEQDRMRREMGLK